jgi:tetratricopeptide (TPR) repeat protein
LGDVLSGPPENPRLAILRSFAEKRPQDPFPRYALAMELKTAGDASGAWGIFETLLAEHPDYIAAYAPAGEVLLALGRREQAREVFARGIEAAGRRNDAHARDHLESSLAELDQDAQDTQDTDK